jgi:hypothetical protein
MYKTRLKTINNAWRCQRVRAYQVCQMVYIPTKYTICMYALHMYVPKTLQS